jgi:nitroimidazol reductase NimA-like FMN-containing flavoprotein (pyridoxamine 5'-phosphate oxidase superfamily)
MLMQAHDLTREISTILDQQMQCVLATLQHDQPCQHMMAFAHAEDLSRIFLATYMDTRKYRNMVTNPSVSILWDNRSGSAADHVDGLSLIALGRAELLAGIAHLEVRELMLKRNPALQVLLEDERCKLFMILIEDYQWTKAYQQVLHYIPTSQLDSFE